MSATDFLPPVWKPHKYQEDGIHWLLTHPEGALFWAPGLGKTSTVLATILKLKEFGYNYPVLILAPLRVCQATWQHEPKRWAQFAHLKIGLAHGEDKLEILRNPRYDIVLLNYDGLGWACEELAKGNRFKILVCDEITKLKHTNTKRFKMLKPLLPTFQFRYGLTGTPAANGLLDLFGQIYVLDLGYRLGKYITHYRTTYFHQDPFGSKWVWKISDRCADLIHKKIADLAMYIKPEEVLKLPPISHITLPVILDGVTLKHYKQLEMLAILEMKDEVLTAANAAVLTGKLRQFASGAIYNSDREVLHVHDAKIKAFEDLVEEMAGEPLFVAYNYDHELDRMLTLYPDALVIRGGMSAIQLEKVLEEWNFGQAPLLLAQVDAAAHGLNLQFGGSAICWFSQTYNLEVYSQLIARLHRQGQENHVRVYHLITEGTIDVLIQKILEGKDVTQEALFAALRQSLIDQEDYLQLR